MAGISGGATVAAALRVAEAASPGARLLAMVPDTGERYLSTPLFEDVAEAMNAEERAIAASTPRYRFDATPAPLAVALPEEVSPAASAYVEEAIGDLDRPVVMFALEWCEFCWSVRRLFDAAAIDYRALDLDSSPSQDKPPASEIRKALHRLTGAPTIPQIFVGAAPIGGATETFDAFNSGALQARLRTLGVAFDASLDLDAYAFLPKWLHPR